MSDLQPLAPTRASEFAAVRATLRGILSGMADTTIDIRVTEPHEWRAAADIFRGALLYAPSADEDWEKPELSLKDSWADSISITAWDGGRCVGHAAGFHFTTVVPGGATLPTSGVSRVGVRQTHTRRGVLTRAMHRLLRDSYEQGKVLASLRASEAVIYSRFGFAVAGECCDIEIDRRRGARVVAPVAPGSIRILEREETLATVATLHARVGLDRPGAVGRAEWMHRRVLADALANEKAAYVIVHTAPDGTDDGWALYTTEWPDSFGEHVGGVCEVADVWGADAMVELALWKFILELDLVDTVRGSERPIDDAVRFALANPRHYHAKLRYDEQWLRVLDADAALRARTYAAAADAVTIAVTDPLFEHNNGVWRVSATGAERVSLTPAEADLATTINGLSAAYLGGTAWSDLHVCSQVLQQHPGAVATADLLFASRPLPRCGTFF